jgi:hypothetical protein
MSHAKWQRAGDVIVGALGFVMVVLAAAVYMFYRGLNPISPFGAVVLGVAVLAAYGSNWVGWNRGTKEPEAAKASTVPLKAIVACPECGQFLRIPADKGKLVVHCAKCSYAWGWEPIQGPRI